MLYSLTCKNTNDFKEIMSLLNYYKFNVSYDGKFDKTGNKKFIVDLENFVAKYCYSHAYKSKDISLNDLEDNFLLKRNNVI